MENMTKIWIEEKAEIEKILREMDFGFLGLSNNEKPYVIPISYAYEGNRIYLHAALKGLKLEYIRNNPQVCFTVAEQQQLIPNLDPCKVSVRYRSVIARGKATLVEEPDDKITALQIIAAKYSPGSAGSAIDSRKANSVAVIVIEIEEITGKCNVDG
jgi:nitroimidazol reductase NimA-like FMN-containing flavoprotein (pyridoxamine 5'-phosphate oxidase superfamily)